MFFKEILVLFSSLIIQTLSEVPTITLNDGHKMPILGLETCYQDKGLVLDSVKEAIDMRYRHIDTAYINDNEVDIGLAIDQKFDEAIVKRSDVFITTKLWNTFHSKNRVKEAIKMALDKLTVNYIDLMLIHWPMGYFEGSNDYPKNSKGDIIFSSVDYLETWKALEESVDEGLVKSIGVSNFNSEQLERILEVAHIKPAVNQIESHPQMTQKPLIDWCHKHGIAVIAYNPFADGYFIEDPILKKIGDNHKKSRAQVMLRYQIQREVAVIADSIQRDQLKEYLNVFDFVLSPQEMQEIDSLNQDMRYFRLDAAKKHKYYPFSIPYL